jgi:hypothetical protein
MNGNPPKEKVKGRTMSSLFFTGAEEAVFSVASFTE